MTMMTTKTTIIKSTTTTKTTSKVCTHFYDMFKKNQKIYDIIYLIFLKPSKSIRIRLKRSVLLFSLYVYVFVFV